MNYRKETFFPHPILTQVSFWSVWNFKDYLYSFTEWKQKDQLLKKHGHHCVKYKFFWCWNHCVAVLRSLNVKMFDMYNTYIYPTHVLLIFSEQIYSSDLDCHAWPATVTSISHLSARPDTSFYKDKHSCFHIK